MGMRVRLRDAAMGSPASMAKGSVTTGQARRCLADLADALVDQQSRGSVSIAARGDTPRGVSALVELLQSGEHELGRLVARSNVAENATHGRWSSWVPRWSRIDPSPWT